MELALSFPSPDTTFINSLFFFHAEAYKKEENLWRQRSRVLWLQASDQNSAFFHAVTNGRRARNRLTVIEVGNGTIILEEDKIGDVFIDYIKQLFTSTNPTDFRTIEESISSNISPDTNLKLSLIPDEA